MIYSKWTFAIFQGECKDKSGGKDKSKNKDGKDHKMKDKKKKEKKEGKKSGDSSSSSSDGVGPNVPVHSEMSLADHIFDMQ